MSFLGVLVGLLVALVPGGSASAARSCPADDFRQRLVCWIERADEGPVLITLRGRLDYQAMGDEQREVSRLLSAKAHPLVVEVQEGVHTGQGGTALLLFAKGLLIHPGAKIDRLEKSTLEDLKKSGFCTGADKLCGKVSPGEGPDPLKGSDLADHAADPEANRFTVEADEGEADTPSTSSGAQGGQGDSGGEGNEEANNAVGTTQDTGSEAGYSGATWTAFWMALLLALLLLAFVIVIRRSRGPVAVGHRAPSSGRAAGGLTRAAPTRTTPAHAARGGSGGTGGDGGGDGEGGDESTTRLRVASAPRYGRHVGARPAHARTAVVRTELHPQGYVEVDRVLRRAVWAEPGRPPPAPGSLVDVTEARDRDSDVLYAFPPTAARHAKNTPR
ncbi:hypothetical protein ACF1HJ_18560 [Streptomyces sp. NPDC013978]|uniref:hypothetical protein n=1 Tax=Streptomyces sp. NPDC013978 TaxID=3364869 RepID=UPI0036FB36F1